MSDMSSSSSFHTSDLRVRLFQNPPAERNPDDRRRVLLLPLDFDPVDSRRSLDVVILEFLDASSSDVTLSL
jgi:hypothetical protein